MRIVQGDFDHPAIRDLLAFHFADLRTTAPPESCHVLPIDAMRVPELHFFAAWEGETLLGFGAVKDLGDGTGEIKSMRTSANSQKGVGAAGLRKGVGQAMLDHLIAHARTLGLSRLNLETGSMDFFIPARALYMKNGFTECPPFGDYQPDPNSVFMTRAI